MEYVPGTPGAPWTLEEMLTVKAKLHSIFYSGFVANQLPLSEHWRWFSAAKALRLGFHDCLKYKDGTGGCDGCLNWHGVGVEVPFNMGKAYHLPDSLIGNNNGLGHSAWVLEQIYTDPAFPNSVTGFTHTPNLDVSLKASGKSRADLWAFAALTAVEYTIESHNLVCTRTNNYTVEGQCDYRSGTDECKLTLPRPFQFQTGRKDCTQFGDEGYKAIKEEHHPNAHGNGQMTIDFFKESFGFSGREIAAIMGSHTVGRFNKQISSMPYVWTSSSERLFNNHYYKNIVREGFPNVLNKWQCNSIGLADGSPGPARYLAFTERQFESGGPVMWVNVKKQCPNCKERRKAKKAFCKNLPEGVRCHPEGERFRVNKGQDEIALNSEMGLYFDFNVTDGGIPYGCPGFDYFNNDIWSQQKHGCLNCWTRYPKTDNPRFTAKDDWYTDDVNCQLNKMQVPSGSTPMHEIYEEYAADQQKWIEDYVPTFEKMISNGYGAGELTNAPDHYTNVICPRPKENGWSYYFSCYQSTDIPK